MNGAVALPNPASDARPIRVLGDAHLMRLAAHGDQRAFAAIYERYHQELYRYCRAILTNPEEAKDALQNTMLNALRSLPGEQRQLALRPWLYRVAHNEAIQLLRGRRRLAELEPGAEPSAAGPDQQVETRLRLERLIADLGALPARQRGALIMRELSGLSYSQIAVALETSPAAARQTVYKARSSLYELTKGREMGCDQARQALSANDGRILRSRKLRAHLRQCPDCRDFRAAITERRSDLAALAPPLPALAAAGILKELLGGHGGGTGGGISAWLGGGTGKALVSPAIAKIVAALAVLTITIGTAAVAGLIRPPFEGSSASGAANSASAYSENAQPLSAERASGRSVQRPKAGSAGVGKSHQGHRTRLVPNQGASHIPTSAHPTGPPAFGRSLGQQQAQSHAPQPSASAQAHPGPSALPGSTTKIQTPSVPAPAGPAGHR